MHSPLPARAFHRYSGASLIKKIHDEMFWLAVNCACNPTEVSACPRERDRERERERERKSERESERARERESERERASELCTERAVQLLSDIART